MSHPDDWTEFRAAIRLTREIFAQPAFDRYRGEELQPGAEATSDEAIDAFIRQHVESAYHPCSTCRMGAVDDPEAVVGPDTRVIGVENLRVADSSIMPTITTGNLNAPDHHAGRKGRRPHPRRADPAALERAVLRGGGMGNAAEVDWGAAPQGASRHPPTVRRGRGFSFPERGRCRRNAATDGAILVPADRHRTVPAGAAHGQ